MVFLTLFTAATVNAFAQAPPVVVIGKDNTVKTMAFAGTNEGKNPDFQITDENIVNVDVNGKITLMPVEGTLFTNAKILDVNQKTVDVPVVNNQITFATEGVFTLTVLAGQNAYTCIVVVGEPEDQEQVVEKQISNTNTWIEIWIVIIFEEPQPDTPTPTPCPTPPCDGITPEPPTSPSPPPCPTPPCDGITPSPPSITPEPPTDTPEPPPDPCLEGECIVPGPDPEPDPEPPDDPPSDPNPPDDPPDDPEPPEDGNGNDENGDSSNGGSGDDESASEDGGGSFG